MNTRPVHAFRDANGNPGTAVSASPATVTSLASTPSREGFVCYEVTAVASGGLTGAFTIEYSHSTDLEIKRGTDTWSTYTPNDNSNAAAKSLPAISLAGTASVSHLLEISNAKVDRTRIKFVRATGAGTVYARVKV